MTSASINAFRLSLPNPFRMSIECADNFVYLASLDILKLSYHQQEFDHAFANNKRIISLLIQENDHDNYRSEIDKLLKELKSDASYYEAIISNILKLGSR